MANFLERASFPNGCKSNLIIFSLKTISYHGNNRVILYFKTSSSTFVLLSRWSKSDEVRKTHLRQTSSILAFIMTSYEISYHANIIITYAIAWNYARKLAKWLNRMNELDKNMCRLCSEFWITEIKDFSRQVWFYLVFYVGLPSLIFGSVVFTFGADWNLPGYTIILIVCSFAPHICLLSLDALLILMFGITEKAFKSVIRVQFIHNHH
jgi:hypothetical protein